MSISSLEELIVCVHRSYKFWLDLYKSSDVTLIESIILPEELESLYHAVQLLNGNFMIAHSMKDTPNAFTISEFSFNERTFIRCIAPRLIVSNQLDDWWPCYLSIDEHGSIFVADGQKGRVCVLDSRLTDVQIMLCSDQHSEIIKFSWRLCYVPDNQQLIVISKESTRDVRMLNLRPRELSIGHRTFESELDVIKSALFTTNLREIKLLKRFEIIKKINENPVLGVTWLKNKIYVVCEQSNMVHVFQDHPPFSELEGITIKRMTRPYDIAASEASRTIFISDGDERCVWTVQMLDTCSKIRKWKIDGCPETLSITLADNLSVVVRREDRYTLDICSCSDVNQTHSIYLPQEIQDIRHMFQPSSGNAIISYSTERFPSVYMISELSINEGTFIHTFDPRLVRSVNIKNWKPEYLSIDGEGHIFVADSHSDRVYQLNSQLTDVQILLNRVSHRLVRDQPDFATYKRINS